MPVPVVIGIIVAFIITMVIMYSVRSWYRSWSATTDEVNDKMPGDEEIGTANYIITTAITIRSPVSDVWPWLVQMGYRRGGMYSYDWIDRLLGILDRPSSKEIIPEFQHLEVGDAIPMGSGSGWPVRAIEPNHSLLLVIKEPGVDVTWSFLLKEIDRDTTRFILRIRTLIPMKLLLRILTPIVKFGAFLMIRKMLLGIKQRAETISANT